MADTPNTPDPIEGTDPPDRRLIGDEVEAAQPDSAAQIAAAMPRPSDPAGIIATETAEGGRIIWTRGDRAQLVALCRAIIDQADLAADFAAWTNPTAPYAGAARGEPTGDAEG